MMGFLTGIPAQVYLVGALVLAALAIVGGAYYEGRRTANAEWEAATLKKSVELLRTRRDTDANIHGLPDADLCAAVGGVWSVDKLECL